MAPEIKKIHAPAPLRDLPRWCVWAYEQHPGEAKARKVPQYTNGGRRYGKQGSPEDLAKLTTFALARDAAARRGLDGVGFALTQDCGIVALDFDNAVIDGKIDPVVVDLVKNTYAEYSPSGKGVRAFYRGNIGNRKSFSNDGSFSVEAFSTTGFVTVTGNMLPFVEVVGHEDTIAKITPEVLAFCEQRFGAATAASAASSDPLDNFSPKLGLTLDESEELLQQLDPDMPRPDWIKVALALSHEHGFDEDAFQLFNEWSSAGSKYPGEEEVRYQWESLENRTGYRPVTMATVKKMAKENWEPDLHEVARTAPPPIAFDGKYPAVHASALNALQTSQWLIKGVLPASRDPIILFGASGSGKSFVAIDLCCAIARGIEWRGHRVKRGRVLYIAAEGSAGIGKRLRAYCDHHNIDMADLALDVVAAAPNILDKEDISELVKTLSTFGPYVLAVVDTFAQVTPGANENSGEDMGPALANIKAVQEATGATVIAVHHAGKDLARGSRGWSGLKAAAEAQLEVLRDEDTGARQLHVEKMKDGEDGARYAFKLDVLQVGIDEDGDPITSCVAVPTDLPPKQEVDRKGLKRRGRMQNHVLEMLELVDKSLSVIKREDFIKLAAENLPPPAEGQRDTRRQHVARAIDELAKEKDGPLKLEGNLVVLFE
ncbi:MAG TPA: AAA family ATPase [Terriglobales bacterium]|nr:AAA family ATPase [Terriglobales bacterium]